ncbi:MAG: undecaprenyl-diphosphate phosphatase [Lachnospiraceae bacterium]|nr:undecaprenyl-diphosphate phosphatase [Lachnospiraceae bacterium]
MTFIQAIILGIVQGLTEFLPVSSSGHLAIMKNLLHMNLDTGALYDVLLHVATLVAVCIVMHKDIIKLIVETISIIRDIITNASLLIENMSDKRNKAEYIQIMSTSYRKFVVMIIVSTIPTGILGVLLNDIIETVESELLVPGICLICTAVIILISDFLSEGNKKAKDMNIGDAFAIGSAQGIATLPGLSRSGATITACILCGLDRKFAVKYSFIMSIPAILGALILKLSDVSKESVSGGEIVSYIVGMIVAAVVGYFALIFTSKIVQKKSFKYFAFYCFGIGAVSIIAYILSF